MNEKNNITIKEMILALNQLQSQAEKDFRNYTKNIYHSKVKSHFPHMMTPTYQGYFIKISDCYLDNDSNYIDLEQQVNINIKDEQQIFNSAISTRILPFDVVNVQAQSKGIEITFEAKLEKFSLQHSSFSFWLYTDYMSTDQLIIVFNKLSKITEFSLSVDLEDGSLYKETTDVSYGYEYVQHSNHKFRQNIADPRLQFRININLHNCFSQKIKSIKILINGLFIDRHYHDQLDDLFHTNLIPVVNQYQTISDSFIMDGDHEIYWLKPKEEVNPNFCIHEVLTVYVDKQPLASIDYIVIYKDGMVGLEFNQISEVFNKQIFASIYISYKANKSLMDNYHKADARWLNQHISTYELNIKSPIAGTESISETKLIEPLLKILKIQSIHKWQFQDWQGLLIFTDLSSSLDIHKWLNNVTVNEQQVCLYFKGVSEDYHEFIIYYLSQLEIFLEKNTVHNFRIKEIFQ
jgi:hypothetical protein